MNNELTNLICWNTWWISDRNKRKIKSKDVYMNLRDQYLIDMVVLILRDTNAKYTENSDRTDKENVTSDTRFDIPNQMYELYEIVYKFLNKCENAGDFIVYMIEELESKDLSKETNYILQNIRKTLIQEFTEANKVTNSSNIPDFNYSSHCLYFAGYIIDISLDILKQNLYMNTLVIGKPLAKSVELSYLDASRNIYDTVYRNAIYPRSNMRKSSSLPDVPVESNTMRSPRSSSTVSAHRRAAALQIISTERGEKAILPIKNIPIISNSDIGRVRSISLSVSQNGGRRNRDLPKIPSIPKSGSNISPRHTNVSVVSPRRETMSVTSPRRVSGNITSPRRVSGNITSPRRVSGTITSPRQTTVSMSVGSPRSLPNNWQSAEPTPPTSNVSSPRLERKVSWMNKSVWDKIESIVSYSDTIIEDTVDTENNILFEQLVIGVDIVNYMKLNMEKSTDIERVISKYKSPDINSKMRKIIEVAEDIITSSLDVNIWCKKLVVITLSSIVHNLVFKKLETINKRLCSYIDKYGDEYIPYDKHEIAVKLSILGELMSELRVTRDSAELDAMSSLSFSTQYDEWDRNELLQNTIDKMKIYSDQLWSTFNTDTSSISDTGNTTVVQDIQTYYPQKDDTDSDLSEDTSTSSSSYKTYKVNNRRYAITAGAKM